MRRSAGARVPGLYINNVVITNLGYEVCLFWTVGRHETIIGKFFSLTALIIFWEATMAIIDPHIYSHHTPKLTDVRYLHHASLPAPIPCYPQRHRVGSCRFWLPLVQLGILFGAAGAKQARLVFDSLVGSRIAISWLGCCC